MLGYDKSNFLKLSSNKSTALIDVWMARGCNRFLHFVLRVHVCVSTSIPMEQFLWFCVNQTAGKEKFLRHSYPTKFLPPSCEPKGPLVILCTHFSNQASSNELEDFVATWYKMHQP
jgi:hypothetical protein